jgi:hypothetical protein
MNYKPENSAMLIQTYLKQARERLESARVLLEIGNLGDSISRSYYALLDAATACLIKKDIVPKSHSGAIQLFSLHYIKSGLVDKEYLQFFTKIERARLDADYKHERVFSSDEAADALKEAIRFIDMAERLLS